MIGFSSTRPDANTVKYAKFLGAAADAQAPAGIRRTKTCRELQGFRALGALGHALSFSVFVWIDCLDDNRVLP